MQSAPPALGPRLNPCAHPWNGKKSTYLIGFGANLGNPTYELPAAGTDDEARGYFTSALVEGLRGAAPRDRHGALTAKNLASYVKTVVAARTADQPFPQQADIVGALDADIVFGAAVAPPKRKITLVLPARFAGTATLVKDGRSLDSHEGGGEWKLELEDGLYEVVAGRRQLKNDGLFKVAGKGRRVPL